MARSGPRGQLRIIGGTWRGRKLHFRIVDGLRPTSDRTRETLFNWLAPTMHGARCLDLFAGSGALGLEGLSRGAAHCHFVDSSRTAVEQIGSHLAALDASDRARCTHRNAEAFLATATGPFDIVFVDPPFNHGLTGPVCELLQTQHLLAADARVYIESGADETAPHVPAGWRLHREKIAGAVCYRLYIA